MSLTSSTQASVAFKNISGKSMTDTSKGVNNEAEGIFFNVDSRNIWTGAMSPTPSFMINTGDAVFVTADLTLDITSNGRGYFATWPSTAPIGTDPITLSSYSYGTGLLSDVSSGVRVTGAIPPSYGVSYEAKPYSSGSTLIPPGDARNWIYQYNSGVFFQQDVVGSSPVSIDLYVYTGNLLSDTTQASVVSANIRISATGVDNYTGNATPSIATYSSSDLYLVDFSNTNTGSTVSLNIDGLGAIDVIKFDEDGFPIGLSASDISVGQIYYVIWDGNNFQLNISNPNSQSEFLYTNPLGSVAVGGILAGTTFSNATMKQMWDILLKPTYQQPQFSSFTFNHGGVTREVGNNIVGGTYSFTWGITYPVNILANSITIKNDTTNTNLIVGTANDSQATLTLPTINTTAQTSHRWKILATRTNSTGISTTVTLAWYWKRFNGTQSATSLSDAQIVALNGSGSGALSSSRVGTYAFGSGSYKYFAWPVTFGGASLFRDSATNLAVSMAGISDGYTTPVGVYYAQIVSITNTYGKTINYYVFRTRNILGGLINIVVT